MSNGPKQHDTADYSTLPADSPDDPLSLQADVAALSHPGLVRANNEDVYLVVQFGRFWQTRMTNLPAGLVPDLSEVIGYGLLVADGVGGHSAGEVASRLAASTLVQLVLNTPDWILLAGESEWSRIAELARQRYRHLDARLRAEVAEHPELAGMGTTLTVVRNLGRNLFVAHVGDSRAYLLHGNELQKITHDHTLAQELADAGSATSPDDMPPFFRHALTRALGGKLQWAGVDVGKTMLDDGDQVLVCSDGLTDMVDEPTIARTLRESPTAGEACKALVDLALKNGGKDNVTVALARYRIEPEPRPK